MPEDQAKKFQAQLLRIEQYLRKIKEIGMDTSRLEAIILTITEELERKIKATNDSYDDKKKINNYLQEGYLESHYQEAIKLLDELEQKIIEEYNTYVKIDGICQEIESQMDNITKENINKFLLSIKKALNLCNTSSTQDYKNEETIIENVYELAYQIIKKEIILTNQSELLTYINDSELDAPYLERIILKEIDSLDLSHPENKNIVKKLKSMNSRGLESNHLDLELIYLLSIPKRTEAYREKKEKILTLDSQLEDNNKKILDLQKDRDILLDTVKNQKKEVIWDLKMFLKPVSILTVYTTACISLAVGGLVLANKVSNRKVYPTTEKVYDIKTNTYLPPTEYDSISLDDTIQLVTYNTWEKNKSTRKYEREILTYDLSEIEYENLADYATLDLDALGIKEIETTEYQLQLTPEDLYEEAYSVIREITQDKTEYNTEKKFPLIFMLFVLIQILYPPHKHTVFYKKLCCNQYNLSDCLQGLNKFLYSLKKYKLKTKTLQEKTQELQKLIKLSNQLLQILETEYNQLPEFVQEDEELTSSMKRVRKPNNS